MDERRLREVDALLAVVGSALTIALALRLLVGKDAVKVLQMKGYRAASRYSKAQGNAMLNLAAHCDTQYHRLTMVTV